MDPKALFQLTYGLYVLTTRHDGRDNGCIINTVMQVAEQPVRLAIALSKRNLSCEMVRQSKRLNISAITTGADFSLFQRFGFQSGRDADKFEGFAAVRRSENGLYYLTENSSAYLSAKVLSETDLGTHILFIAEVEDGQVLSGDPPCTYTHYQTCIKPKPAPAKQKSWVCQVCGYVHEGDELPEGFVCPLCKHGREAFQLVE